MWRIKDDTVELSELSLHLNLSGNGLRLYFPNTTVLSPVSKYLKLTIMILNDYEFIYLTIAVDVKHLPVNISEYFEIFFLTSTSNHLKV